MEDIIDESYSIEPMIDLCNEYVDFLMTEEKNKIVINDEIKEVKSLNNCSKINVIFEKRIISNLICFYIIYVCNNYKFQIEFDISSDPLFGKRVHAWVMVMPLENKNDKYSSEISYFIEPSTGERKEISDENYTGIEVVWNNTNYWVNLQFLEGGCTVCVYHITDYHTYTFC